MKKNKPIKPETTLFKEVLHESRMSGVEFADAVGEPQPNVSRWKNGHVSPPLSKIVEMAGKVGLKITYQITKI